MKGFVATLEQLALATGAIAAICALVGFLVAHFPGWSGVSGVGWGMIAGGGVIALVTGGSGSPADMLVAGRRGAFATYWGQSAPLSQTPLVIAIGAFLVFLGGLALMIAG